MHVHDGLFLKSGGDNGDPLSILLTIGVGMGGCCATMASQKIEEGAFLRHMLISKHGQLARAANKDSRYDGEGK